MHAMVLNAYKRPLEFEPVPEPESGAEDLVLEALACGVCATDLKIVRGDVPSVTLPHIPGHEIVGAVAEVGGDAEDRFKRGDTVCCHSFVPCNSCNNCQRGHINVCELLAGGDGAGRLGFELQGAYAQYVRVPSSVAVRIPSDVDPTSVCITPDAVATAYRAVDDGAEVREGDDVVIIGAGGGLGVHPVQIAASSGAHVIAVDRGEERLGFAASSGAREVIDAASFPADADGLKVDKVIDFAGVLGDLAILPQLLRAGGLCVAVGYRYGSSLCIPYHGCIVREIRIRGIRGSTFDDFVAALDAVVAGEAQPVVSARFPLEAANEALDHVARGERPGRTVLDLRRDRSTSGADKRVPVAV